MSDASAGPEATTPQQEPSAVPAAEPGPSAEQHAWTSAFCGIDTTEAATDASSRGLFDRIGSAIGGAVDKAEDIASDVAHDVGNAASSVATTVENAPSLGALADTAAQGAIDAGAGLAQKAVDALPLPDALKGAATSYVKLEKGVAEGVYSGVKSLASDVETAAEMVDGRMLAKGVTKLAKAAVDEDARKELGQDIKDGANTVIGIGKLGIALQVDPASVIIPIGQQIKDGYDKAAAKGEGEEFVGKGLGQAAVVVGTLLVGGEGAEAAKLAKTAEEAALAAKAAEEAALAAKAAEEAALAAKAAEEAAAAAKAAKEAEEAAAALKAAQEAKEAEAAAKAAKDAEQAEAAAKAAERAATVKQSPEEIDAKIKQLMSSANKGDQLEGQAGKLVKDAGFDVQSAGRKVGPNGSTGDIDIEVPEAIIEATTQRSKKLSQITKLVGDAAMNPAGKPVILYAPNYMALAGKDILAAGAKIARTPEELIALLKSLRGP